MQLIAPDVLMEGRGLSPALSGCGVAIGCLIWLCGWRWNRFWVVMAVTVGGGLYGLHSGRAAGSNMLAMGILLAVSAGLLALELSRVLAFLAAGITVWQAASLLLPSGQQLWVVFLLGGLGGVLLYRLWMMLLTSFIGTLITWHSGFCLADRMALLDSVDWAANHSAFLNGIVLAGTVAGVLTQSWLERKLSRQRKRKKKEAEEKMKEDVKAEVIAKLPSPKPKAKPWWKKVMG